MGSALGEAGDGRFSSLKNSFRHGNYLYCMPLLVLASLISKLMAFSQSVISLNPLGLSY